MNSKIGYTGVFIAGSCGARPGPYGAKGARMAPKILFNTRFRHVSGMNRKNPAAVLNRLVKSALRRTVSVALNAFYRLSGFPTLRQDMDAVPIRVQPLKTKAKIDPMTAGIQAKPFAKTGKSDADALIEMKKNSVTSVYEVKRIIAAVG